MHSVPVAMYSQDIAEAAKQARHIFESFMQKHDVPRSTGTKEALSFGWFDEAPEGEGFVGGYGRVFDAIVMNRPEWSADTPISPVAATADRHQRVDRVEL